MALFASSLALLMASSFFLFSSSVALFFRSLAAFPAASFNPVLHSDKKFLYHHVQVERSVEQGKNERTRFRAFRNYGRFLRKRCFGTNAHRPDYLFKHGLFILFNQPIKQAF